MKIDCFLGKITAPTSVGGPTKILSSDRTKQMGKLNVGDLIKDHFFKQTENREKTDQKQTNFTVKTDL